MIYLDNNATTPLEPNALEAMLPWLNERFVNPSSGSREARSVRGALDQSREQLARLLGCEPGEIVYTSGGTEADNTAIFSATEIYPARRHIITSVTEHDAVLKYLGWLESTRGYEITRLGVDESGDLDLHELAHRIRPNETALISLMWANNETGVVWPIADAAEIAAQHDILFHSDIVQAAGKIPLQLGETKVHYAAISGHKFHGPKGIGALYVNRHVPFHPLLHGGGQERDRRAGTENVAAIVGMGVAAEHAWQHLSAPTHTLRDYFESELRRRIPDITVNGLSATRTPNTSNVRIPGTQAEGLMILLEQKGIHVSAGSACHTGALHPSPVLAAMGLSSEQARECLRVSFSRFNTQAEVDILLDALEAATRKMRQIFQPLEK